MASKIHICALLNEQFLTACIINNSYDAKGKLFKIQNMSHVTAKLFRFEIIYVLCRPKRFGPNKRQMQKLSPKAHAIKSYQQTQIHPTTYMKKDVI